MAVGLFAGNRALKRFDLHSQPLVFLRLALEQAGHLIAQVQQLEVEAVVPTGCLRGYAADNEVHSYRSTGEAMLPAQFVPLPAADSPAALRSILNAVLPYRGM
ncbi:hypothetical protein MB02_14185 [Croceicoccus estronivorus]|nr:hypothetical protein MB02_14185 [Croceicoccus estronivorus]